MNIILNINNIFQTDKVIQLIMEAEKFSWHLLDAITYDHIINWHVMSCDSRVVLHVCNDQCHPIDVAIHKYI